MNLKKLTGGKAIANTKTRTVRRMAKEHKANPELAILAHSIRNGSGVKLNPYHPPKHITFEMLWDEVGTGKEPSKDPHPADEEKSQRIKMWRTWYKIMKGYNTYGKATKSMTGGGQKTDIELLTELNRIRSGILDIVSKSRKREKIKEHKEELLYFKNTEKDANKYVKNALQIKYDVDALTPEDIKALIENPNIKYPSSGYASLYRPTNTLYMYGMQLPHQYDRLKLFETMLYLISKENIYNYVDLHDCYKTSKEVEDVMKGTGCNPYDRQAQLAMWEKAAIASGTSSTSSTSSERFLYYGVEGYEDMLAGSAGAWESISKIKDVKDPSNSVVIHCLAGAGRTGSVMFYLLLRDNFDPSETIERLQKKHYGYASISECIENYKSLFTNSRYAADIEYMKKEVFDVSKQASASRFRQRLNRIFFHLAKELKVNTFYTYGVPTEVIVNLPTDEFANPIMNEVKWEEIQNEDVVQLFR